MVLIFLDLIVYLPQGRFELECVTEWTVVHGKSVCVHIVYCDY